MDYKEIGKVKLQNLVILEYKQVYKSKDYLLTLKLTDDETLKLYGVYLKGGFNKLNLPGLERAKTPINIEASIGFNLKSKKIIYLVNNPNEDITIKESKNG